MVGVPGIAERLFGALARSGISVILISQASSEHSICFAVPAESAFADDGRRRRRSAIQTSTGIATIHSTPMAARASGTPTPNSTAPSRTPAQ